MTSRSNKKKGGKELKRCFPKHFSWKVDVFQQSTKKVLISNVLVQMRWLSCYWCWWYCWDLNIIGGVSGDNGGAAKLFTRPPLRNHLHFEIEDRTKVFMYDHQLNLQAHGTRPTQESFVFSRPTLFFWVWVCKELLRLVEPSGHWSRREASQLLSHDLLQWLCRSSSDVKTNTNTQKCKVKVFRFHLIVL